MWEKYLAERVLPGFGVSCKNDRKSLTYGFGVKFPSAAELSHQLPKRPSRLAWRPLIWLDIQAWIPGFRRLTLGSRVSVVSLVIPYSDPFFRKFFPEKS